MKRLKFHRAIVAIAMMLIGWLPSLAHHFEINGVFYNVISTTEVEVTYKGDSYDSYSNEYIGDVVVPSSVKYNGVTYSVTSIGYDAFQYCSSLTSIEIPNSVTSIEKRAFSHCTSLTSIEIPNSVTSIENGAFSWCESLTSIVVDSGNTKYDSRNGCNAIIETASNTLIAGCQNTIIPNSVTSIGYGAFYGCTGLTGIEIPNSVTSIGYRAFLGCSGLTSIEIPNSVTSIGDYAFLGCESLTSIVVDYGNAVYDSRNGCNAIIETVSNTLIVGCQNTIIPNNVTSIGDGAFSDCSSLTSIQIPNSVTSIGDGAFSDCSSLISIQIPNSVTRIGDGAFSQCINLTSVEMSNSVKIIGEWVFSGCISLTSIEIPNGVTTIGDDAFNGCRSLTSVVIGNGVTSIGDNAFDYCTSLTSIEIPNSVTSIGYGAFAYCYSLTSIEIPNSVTSIGYGAFNGCYSLTSIEIPNSVTSIGDAAFNGCSSLTSIVVDSCNTEYDSRNGCNAIIETASNTLIAGCQSTIIPNSVTSIGYGAFYGCTGLTGIEIPNSVTSIGDWAFNGCSSLTSIEIPNSVTSIGDYAFFWCDSLTEIKCWATTPPTIYSNTFSNYSADLYVPTGCKAAYEVADYWENFNNIIEVTLDKPITLNDNDAIVATIGDNIVVKNAKLGSVVNVYSSNGALIKSMTATDGSVVIEAPIKDIYVVAIDGKSFKVMVK